MIWIKTNQKMNHIKNYSYLSIYIYIYMHKKLVTIVEGDPKAPFSLATTPRYQRGHYSFPCITPFTLVQYLIMLSVKQTGIKYHLLSVWQWFPTGVLTSSKGVRSFGGGVETMNFVI